MEVKNEEHDFHKLEKLLKKDKKSRGKMFTRFQSFHFLSIALIALLYGCASQTIQNKHTILSSDQPTALLDSKKSIFVEDASEIRAQLLTKEAIYLDSSEMHQARLGKFVEKIDEESQITEKQKIKFLLDSVRGSANGFYRNGGRYTSVQAADWLRWKMHHKQFKSKPIITGQEFIKRVASRSNTTGDPYQVVRENGKRYKMGEVLQNELSSLEEAIRVKQTPIPVEEPAIEPALNYTASAETPGKTPTVNSQAGSALLIPTPPSNAAN